MNGRHYLLTAALALCSALAGHALYAALASPRTVEAREAVRPRDGGWEYCAVVKAQTPGSTRLVYWIVNFKGEGVRIEPSRGRAFRRTPSGRPSRSWATRAGRWSAKARSP